jgi:tryptophan synthase alpha chain
MSRISSVFRRLQGEGRKALIPFITAGDPEPGMTLSLMKALVDGGADIIELGVPFSDPMAEGPTIQRACERALAWGVSLHMVLAMVDEFRKQDADTPVVLMGYANPIEAYGIAEFAADAAAMGVDGVLVVDYPPHECRDFTELLTRHGIDQIFLVAPTSDARRIAEVGRNGRGYIYYVALTGVTGASHLNLDDVAARVPAIRGQVGMPVGVGFGIRDAESAARVASVADAVVIGSRIVEEIQNSPPAEAASRLTAFVRSIRTAMDGRAGR